MYVHEVLVNRLGGLSLPRKSVVRLTDRPDMTLDVYRGCKTTMQQQQQLTVSKNAMYENCIVDFLLNTCICHYVHYKQTDGCSHNMRFATYIAYGSISSPRYTPMALP